MKVKLIKGHTHRGVFHLPGSEIELSSEEAAKRLAEKGVCEFPRHKSQSAAQGKLTEVTEGE